VTSRRAVPLLVILTGLFVAAACGGPQRQDSQAASSTTLEPSGEQRRVLVVLTSHAQLGDTGRTTGFYLSEVSHPHRIFTEAGFQIDFVSPQGGEAPMDGVNRDDPVNAAFLDDATLVGATRTTRRPADVNAADYDAIFFAGGHGTMWDLPDNSELQNIAAAIYESGGVVAAVCHGPAGLVNIRLSSGAFLVAGHRVTGFTNDEEDAAELTDVMPFLLETRLGERGAEFHSAANFQPNVVTSDRLVTGQNPASAAGVADAVVTMIR
jgi:putative intracellular protease/amidase